MSRRRRKTAKRTPEPADEPAPPQGNPPPRPNKLLLWIAIVLLAVWVTFLVTLALAT